jgi:predicted helicase
LKLTNTLKETGFTGDAKLNIFLTNTLEKPLDVKGTSGDAFSTFLKALNVESNGADAVKTNKDIKVIIGNPPYNSKSKNQSVFITDMMKPYVVGGAGPALNDDYIKFIRYAENLIDQNGSGVVAYITNNSFLSGAKTYGMRQSLLKTFDEIYVLDFQGEPKDNIFKIQVPVCITFFVKKTTSQDLGKVYYAHINGSTQDRLSYCEKTSFNAISFTEISLIAPQYYFYPQEASTHEEYCKDSFQLGEDIFHFKSYGAKTNCDRLVIDPREAPLKTKVNAYLQKKVRPDGVSESVFKRGKGLSKIEDGTLMRIAYRPFDTQHYFESSLSDRRGLTLLKQAKAPNQLFLLYKASCWDKNAFSHILITREVTEYASFAHGATHSSPLYQYHAPDVLNSEPTQSTNFKDEFLKTFGENIGMSFQDAPELITPSTFSSLNVFDYIYGVLHDEEYRAKYNAFLKNDYPRVPYPKTQEEFLAYVTKGKEFRELHLSEGEGWEDEIKLGGKGGGEVKPSYDKGILNLTPTLSIDLTQEEWEFKIGACSVIQSWLGYREGLELTQKELNEFKRLVVRVRKHIELLGK